MVLVLASCIQVLAWLYVSNRILKILASLVCLATAFVTTPKVRQVSNFLTSSPEITTGDRFQTYRKFAANQQHRFRFKLWDKDSRAARCGQWKEQLLYILGTELGSLEVQIPTLGVKLGPKNLSLSQAYNEKPTQRLEAIMEMNETVSEFEVVLKSSRNFEIVIGNQRIGRNHYPEAIYFLGRNATCWVVSYAKRTGPS